MDLRSGRGPSSPAPPHIAGSDLISALPDEMLLLVLARLRCARTAARTGLLSRRWRGLWTRLPELTFRDVASGSVEAALALVVVPEVSLLEIGLPWEEDAARASSLLRAAALLSPGELVFAMPGDFRVVPESTLELPCFDRATSIKINARLRVLPSPAGEFPALERLSLCCDMVYIGAWLGRRFPRLRVISHWGTPILVS